MKFLIFILLMLFAQDVYNQGTPLTFITDPVCVTCGPWQLTADFVDCSCPANSVRSLRKYPHDTHFHWGHCCTFKEAKCHPGIDCVPIKHVEPDPSKPPRCKCVCNNLGLLECFNLTVFSTKTCECECPPEAAKKCADNQYLDKKTCSCICKHPCQDCAGRQVWNPHSCTCECVGKMIPCPPKTHFFNPQTCKCECKQAERYCCSHRTWYWDPNTCNCECTRVKDCINSVWNPYACRCDEISTIKDPIE